MLPSCLACAPFQPIHLTPQYSDTDMGSKAPKKILIKGIFYGRVNNPN